MKVRIGLPKNNIDRKPTAIKKQAPAKGLWASVFDEFKPDKPLDLRIQYIQYQVVPGADRLVVVIKGSLNDVLVGCARVEGHYDIVFSSWKPDTLKNQFVAHFNVYDNTKLFNNGIPAALTVNLVIFEKVMRGLV